MNSTYTHITLKKTVCSAVSNKLLLLSLVLLGNWSITFGQINVSYTFDSNNQGWGLSLVHTNQNTCVTGNNALRQNYYSSRTSGTTSSPDLGTSNGGAVTISYKYKIMDYGSPPVNVVSGSWGNLKWQWYDPVTNTWPDIASSELNSTNDANNTSCNTINIPGFTYPATTTPFVRIVVTRTSGDWYLWIDDITITQGAAPCNSAAISLTSGSSPQTICPGGSIVNMVYTYSGSATGANVTNLPSGLSSSVNTTNKTVTISGTPTASGTFTITTTGHTCGSAASITGTVNSGFTLPGSPTASAWGSGSGNGTGCAGIGPGISAANPFVPTTTHYNLCAAYPGDWIFVSVTAGDSYEFLTNSNADAVTSFVYLTNQAGTSVYTSAEGILTWKATSTEIIRFYVHDAGCVRVNSDRRRWVKKISSNSNEINYGGPWGPSDASPTTSAVSYIYGTEYRHVSAGDICGSSGGAIRFQKVGSWLEAAFSYEACEVSFCYAYNTSTSNTLKLEQSSNGTSWTNVATPIAQAAASTAGENRTYSLLSTTRYLRWTQTGYSGSGNNRIDDIFIKKAVPVPTISTGAATCSAEGTATITNYDGNLTYTFSPSGPSVGAGGVISNATAGTSYTVTAGNGSCTSSASSAFTRQAQLNVPSTPAATITQPTCSVATGTITITAQSNVEYSINGSTYQSSNVFSGLSTATYTIYVRSTTTGYCIASTANQVINAAQTVPTAPTSGTHSPSATQINWNWNIVSGATGYKYNATNNYATATDNGTSTTFTQTGLSCGTAYTLYVWAYNAICNSAATTLTQSTTSCCIAPTNLNYTAGNAIYCLNAPIDDNEPSNDGGSPTSYSISGTLPAGLSFNTTTGVISGTPTALSAATTYTITATNSCGNTTKDITITVIDIPSSVSAVASPNPVCENAALSLTGSATNATIWSWTGPNGFSSIDQNPVLTNLSLAAEGIYTLTAGNICGTSAAVNTASVTVNAAPVATANGFVPAVCQGGTTVALGGIFGGAATSAVWSDGGAGGTFVNNTGSTPNTTTYTATANAPALVTLTLTTSGGLCGSSVANMQIVVNPTPTANAGAAVAPVCQGRTSVALDGSVSSGTISAIWSDGGAGGSFTNNDGSTPNTTTYTPAINAPSTVTLTLTADAGSCGTASASKTITVNTTPTITATVPGSRCDAGTVTLSATPSSGSINWFENSIVGASLGTGNSYTTPSISSTTSYWAEAVAGSCASLQRIEVVATVNTSTTVDAGSALSAICQGGTSAALGGSVGGGATGGVWSDGGIGGSFVPSANDLNAQWIPPTTYSGTATLTLTTLGAASPCSNTAASKNIVVNAAAIANAGADQSVGASEAAQLNGSVTNATGGTWTSNVAGTFSPNATTLNATWLPSNPLFIGTAIITLTTTGATSPCGNLSDVVNITVATPSICSGSTGSGTATFTGGSGGTGDAINEYQVSIDDGTTWAAYTPPNAINIAGASGSVKVRARRADSGCVDSDWNAYTLWYVLERPTAGNINGQTVCLNTATTPITVSASGNSGTLSYQWYQNSTNSNSGGTLISGAMTSSYLPSSLTLGTTYYYNTIGYQGFSGCDATTNAAAITVDGPSVADLAANDWLFTGRTDINWETPTNWLKYDGNNAFSVVSTSPSSANNVMLKTGDCINSNVTVNTTETNPLSINAASANNVTIRDGASLTSLNGNSNIRLHVYGNWLNEGMFYCNTGSVFFNGSGNQTITSKWGNNTLPAPSGVSFNNLLINNSGSAGGFKVITLDNLNVLNTITVTNGTFDIGGNRAYSKKVNNIGNIVIGTGGQMRVNEQ